jgi:hypothetical protein
VFGERTWPVREGYGVEQHAEYGTKPEAVSMEGRREGGEG